MKPEIEDFINDFDTPEEYDEDESFECDILKKIQ